MSVQAKVQLVRIQLQSGTVAVLQFQQVAVSQQAGSATGVAEFVNVSVDDTIGLKVGGVYTLTLSVV